MLSFLVVFLTYILVRDHEQCNMLKKNRHERTNVGGG